MRDYPKSLYFSASWGDADRRLTILIAAEFASKGFLIVGDHPYYRDHSHERDLDYPSRVSEILGDCSGIVMVWPKRDSPQTTSPYMFPEALYAAKSGLPFIVFYTDGVDLDVENSQETTLLAFGASGNNDNILNIDTFERQGFSDLLLENTFCINIKKPASLVGPIKIPANPDQFEEKKAEITEAIGRFAENLPSAHNPKFVFNIIPFAMQREHMEISRVILEQTGLPCFTAEDHRDSQEDITEKWQKYILGTSFAVADLSLPRETCALEVGLAMGKDKPVYILSKREIDDLPYGTHLRPIQKYQSLSQLREAVKIFCQPYRRRIINTEIANEGVLEIENAGFPKWYTQKSWFSLGFKLLAFSFVFSVGIAFLFSGIVYRSAPEQPIISVVVGMLVAVFGITVSAFSKLQQFIEKHVASHIHFSLWAVIFFMVFAGFFLWKSLS